MDNYYNIVINPMVSNIFEGSDKLENVLLLEKLTLNADNNLLNWSCPICFDDINKRGMRIACPYTCNHICCYSCLENECKYIKKNNIIPYKIITCSLCRARPNSKWIQYGKIKTIPLVYKGIYLHVCDVSL